MNKNEIQKITGDICDCYTYSCAHDMVFRYYTYADCCFDDKGKATDTMNSFMEELTSYMRAVVMQDIKSDDMVEKLYDLRDRVFKRTEAVTQLTDCLRLYEYVFNRMPIDDSVNTAINEDGAARDILSAIFAYDDNNIINENIKLAVSQLPVRITKNRFFDLVNDAFTKYTGGPSSALDRFLYLLLTTAGIERPASKDLGDLKSMMTFLKKLDEIDYKTIDTPEAAKLAKSLEQKSKKINAYIDGLTDTAMIINALICYLLCYKESTQNPFVGESQIKDALLEALNGVDKPTEWKNAGNEVIDTFSDSFLAELEKKQEKIAVYEGRIVKELFDIDDETRESYRMLDICRKLMSGSYFASLTEEAPIDEVVDTAMAEEFFNRFKAKVEPVFDTDSKSLIRSRMASILAQLPVFFDSRTDVMNYVRSSLESCRDKYEKAVSVELTKRILG